LEKHFLRVLVQKTLVSCIRDSLNNRNVILNDRANRNGAARKSKDLRLPFNEHRIQHMSSDHPLS